MKRLQVLSVALTGLVGVSVVLYANGYWDTWKDKKNKFAAEIFNSMSPQVPQKVKVKLSECVASGLLEVVEATSCPMTDGAVTPQVIACITSTNNEALAEVAVAECVIKAKLEMAEPKIK